MNTSPAPTSELATKSGQYSNEFFSSSAPGSLVSARFMLAHLFELCRPASVVDIGCGQGTWLAAAEELGARQLTGLDGPWVDPTKLSSPNIRFRQQNLDADFEVGEKFDLCISVEVAEHLAPAGSARFVRNLTALSDLIVFSAAIPHQGGVLHINEQHQSYWAGLFEGMGYEPCDLFRPVFWNDARIDAWYRQNLLLYVKPTHPAAARLKAAALRPGPVDVVHPTIFAGNLETYQRAMASPTLRLCCGLFARWTRRQFGKLSPGKGRS